MALCGEAGLRTYPSPFPHRTSSSRLLAFRSCYGYRFGGGRHPCAAPGQEGLSRVTDPAALPAVCVSSGTAVVALVTVGLQTPISMQARQVRSGHCIPGSGQQQQQHLDT